MASKTPAKKSGAKKSAAAPAKSKSTVSKLAAKLKPLKNAILGKSKKAEKPSPALDPKKSLKKGEKKSEATKVAAGKKGQPVAPKLSPKEAAKAAKIAAKEAARVAKEAEKAAKLAAKTAGKPVIPVKSKGVLPIGAYAGKAMDSADSVCREVACEGLATSGGYCRLHYIKNWKKIKRKELILKEKKLNQYIEELVAKYPDKYIEAIRQDLANDKDFAKVIHDLDLDESVDDFDIDGESADSLIDNIKRDFDDDGDF